MWSSILEFISRLGSMIIRRAENPALAQKKETRKNEKAVLEGDAASVNAQLQLGLQDKSDSP